MADDGFDRFWAAYPRRVNKKEARRVWARLRPPPDLIDRMLIALDWQRRQAQWLKDDGVYVPHASTWLRGERWEDEPPSSDAAAVMRRDRALMRPTAVWRLECQRLGHQPPCSSEMFCRHWRRKTGTA